MINAKIWSQIWLSELVPSVALLTACFVSTVGWLLLAFIWIWNLQILYYKIILIYVLDAVQVLLSGDILKLKAYTSNYLYSNKCVYQIISMWDMSLWGIYVRDVTLGYTNHWKLWRECRQVIGCCNPLSNSVIP